MALLQGLGYKPAHLWAEKLSGGLAMQNNRESPVRFRFKCVGISQKGNEKLNQVEKESVLKL